MQRIMCHQDQISDVIILSFVDQNVPITMAQPCPCSQGTVMNNMKMRRNGGFPKRLYLQNQLLVPLLVCQLLVKITLEKNRIGELKLS